MAEGKVWKMLGVEVVKGNKGECELEIEVKEDFIQSYNSVYGGLIGTISITKKTL
ncbi:hypothetical protein [Metabacillus sediminilitoris]|uniref:hypothetical protein n=1 Tax=Metabacillus sediminilitoris TaxID=2567941 RepID=UPI0012D78015|nr:hypothetical protein [Metabacillus sediminilitoris]QGQ44387.1 hypothetical protein GMB29_03405 [Metabacillus sediminilitoris]